MSFVTIHKSSKDPKKYKHIKLENQIDVILVSNTHSKESGCSITVDAGCINDTVPGIAHFLEHMLFLGSKTYPKENVFLKYVTENGGMVNAFTGSDITCYHFTCKNRFFQKGLEILSTMIYEPLLMDNAIDREINAVNAEHKKNMDMYHWKFLDLIKELSNPKHPFHNFSTGNTDTLQINNIREKLVQFYETFYCTDKMKIVLYSDQSIENMMTQFIPILNKIPTKKSAYTVDPILDMYPIETNKAVNIKLYTPLYKHKLCIVWQVPSDNVYPEYNMIQFIFFLLNNHAKNSLYSVLYDQKWITRLDFEEIDTIKKITIIQVSFDLTEEGFQNQANIIKFLFEYIDYITKHLNRVMFDSYKKISQLTYNQNKNDMDLLDVIIELSVRMQKFTIQYANNENLVTGEFTPEFQKIFKGKYLTRLTEPNSIIFSVSDSYLNEVNKTTQYYFTKYAIYPEQSYMDIFKNKEFNYKITFPKQISFQNQFLTNKSNPIHPVEVYSKGNIKVWQMKESIDDTLEIGISMKSIYISDSIQSYVNTELYVQFVMEIIDSDIYDASILNTVIKTSVDVDHIKIFVKGIPHVVQILFDKFITAYIQPNVDKLNKVFPIVKSNVIQEMNIKNKHLLYNQTFLNAKKHLMFNYYSIQDSINCVQNITNVQTVLDCMNRVYRFNDTDILIYTKNCSLTMSLISICSKMENQKFPYKYELKPFNNIFGQYQSIGKTYHSDMNNSACNIFVMFNNLKQDPKLYCIFHLLSLHIKEPFFYELRTKQQVGYIAKVKTLNLKNKLHILSFGVQSPYFKGSELCNKIKTFYNDYCKNIQKMTDNEFEQLRQSFMDQQNIPSNKLFSFYFREIVYKSYEFNLPLQMKKHCKQITKKEFIETVCKMISNKNNQFHIIYE
jgi:insulysin